MFWTWLWGMLGMLLSTPLTVCLAVLGKYVPSLCFFATLLGEEAELDQTIRFYQRLVSLDHDGGPQSSKPRSRNVRVSRCSIRCWSRRSRVPSATRRGASWRRATWPLSGGSSVRSSTTWRGRKISAEAPDRSDELTREGPTGSQPPSAESRFCGGKRQF